MFPLFPLPSFRIPLSSSSVQKHFYKTILLDHRSLFNFYIFFLLFSFSFTVALPVSGTSRSIRCRLNEFSSSPCKKKDTGPLLPLIITSFSRLYFLSFPLVTTLEGKRLVSNSLKKSNNSPLYSDFSKCFVLF